MLTKLDHILLAIPEGAEDVCRPFYTDILGLTEVEKPEGLRGSDGLWLRSSDGAINLHLGIDPDFKPATKAHPAFLTRDLKELSKTLESQGFSVKWNTDIAGVTRFFSFDPVGNRIEFIAEP